MRRITLQPTRRFAFLAVAAHVLVIGVLWWWFSQADKTSPKSGTAQSLTWVSPADFTTSASTGSAAVQVKAEPSPPPVAEKPKPKPEPDNTIKSMLAVAGSAPSPNPASVSPLKPPVPVLPKAIAVDPAQAVALMKAQEEQQTKDSVHAAPQPPTAPPSAAPVVAKSEAPATPAAAKSDPPSAPPTLLATAPALPPAPVSEVSRFITVSSRSSTGAGDKSVRLEEVDRAIRDAFMIRWMPPKAQGLNINQRTAHMNMTVDRAGHVLSFTVVKLSGSEAFDHSLREAANSLEMIPATLPDSYRPDQYEFQLHFHVE
ncbi:MAG: hypothetical protein JWO08_1748 [Verrucomicrobiaceae bacterium]|nr:hypothetical protein [Verrucomicrobiaceae bacterium]